MTSLYVRFPWRGQSNRAESLLKAYGKSRMGPLSVKVLIGAMVNTGNLTKSFFKHNLLRVVVLSRKENLLQFSMYPEAGHTAHIQQGACKPWESQGYLQDPQRTPIALTASHSGNREAQMHQISNPSVAPALHRGSCL